MSKHNLPRSPEWPRFVAFVESRGIKLSRWQESIAYLIFGNSARGTGKSLLIKLLSEYEEAVKR